jgi:hypothetical protein
MYIYHYSFKFKIKIWNIYFINNDLQLFPFFKYTFNMVHEHVLVKFIIEKLGKLNSYMNSINLNIFITYATNSILSNT